MGDVLRRVAAQTGADFVPVEQFDLGSLRYYEPGDPIHFVDEGARVMAAQLAEALRPLLFSTDTPVAP
jgi:lysophospholipase L1-like esterase